MLVTVEARLRQIRLWPGQARAATPWAAPDRPEALAVPDLLAVGIILANADRRVHFVNAAARGILHDTGRLAAEGAPSATDDSENRRLGAWLHQIAQAGPDSGASPLALPCPDGARSLPLLGIPFNADGQAAWIAIFLGDRQKPPLQRAETLSALYGLTPTEARISLLLAGGERPAPIAATLGVSAATVAFHLRNIFEKTGADRQATLVGMLFACPAISDMPPAQSDQRFWQRSRGWLVAPAHAPSPMASETECGIRAVSPQAKTPGMVVSLVWEASIRPPIGIGHRTAKGFSQRLGENSVRVGNQPGLAQQPHGAAHHDRGGTTAKPERLGGHEPVMPAICGRA